MDKAREILAKAIGAEHNQIIFTSSATEANNLAVKGTFLIASKLPRFAKPKILVSAIEHESVLESARSLKNFGAEVIYLPVDRRGVVDLRRLKKELDSRVVLVSVMLGNNEIGTIQPLAEISKMVKKFRGKEVYPLVHSDAAQAFPYIKINVDALGADMLTVSSQKIYGPKGAGALYIRDKKLVAPITSGGSQEYGLRSGTENVPAIVGFSEAVKISKKMKETEARRLLELKQYFFKRTKNALSHVEINGTQEDGSSLPHIISLYFPGERAEAFMARLDLEGFAVSAGSACRARSAEPSYVLLAMGHGRQRALGSIRISFGRATKKNDIDKLIEKLKK